MLLETALPAETSTAVAPHLPTLLIVGEPGGLNVAREALVELELGWEVIFAASAAEAHAVPAVRNVDVILVDLGNPYLEGVELVGSLHTRLPHTPIVLMSAPYAVSVALEAIRKGATTHFPRDLLDSEPAAVLETLRAAARDHRRRSQAAARLDQQAFEFTLANDPAEVPAIAGRLADAAVEVGLTDRNTATRIAVAVEEALVNAIVHGNLEVSSELRQVNEVDYDRRIADRRNQSPYADRRVRLSARLSRAEGVFVVQDEGPGFDVSLVPDPTNPENLFRVGGRGILLMRSFMTAVQFADRGTRVTLIKRRAT
jgi:anti-sigma regulatory factor (Ser/Thr protein kinase)/CheY-like chemotaxis protein